MKQNKLQQRNIDGNANKQKRKKCNKKCKTKIKKYKFKKR